MKSVYAFNDLYPFSNGTQTTSGETIPEEIEREKYNDSSVSRSDGKTEIIDPKMILFAIAGFVGIAMLLNLME